MIRRIYAKRQETGGDIDGRDRCATYISERHRSGGMLPEFLLKNANKTRQDTRQTVIR